MNVRLPRLRCITIFDVCHWAVAVFCFIVMMCIVVVYPLSALEPILAKASPFQISFGNHSKLRNRGIVRGNVVSYGCLHLVCRGWRFHRWRNISAVSSQGDSFPPKSQLCCTSILLLSNYSIIVSVFAVDLAGKWKLIISFEKRMH